MNERILMILELLMKEEYCRIDDLCTLLNCGNTCISAYKRKLKSYGADIKAIKGPHGFRGGYILNNKEDYEEIKRKLCKIKRNTNMIERCKKIIALVYDKENGEQNNIIKRKVQITDIYFYKKVLERVDIKLINSGYRTILQSDLAIEELYKRCDTLEEIRGRKKHDNIDIKIEKKKFNYDEFLQDIKKYKIYNYEKEDSVRFLDSIYIDKDKEEIKKYYESWRDYYIKSKYML